MALHSVIAFSPALIACAVAGPVVPAVCDVCSDFPEEHDTPHEVLLLQVDSAVSRAIRTTASDTGHSVAEKGAVESSVSAMAAVAQIPGYSPTLVTDETLPTILAISSNEALGNVGSARCHEPLPEGDDARPFEDVLADHPEVTGWCHYGGLGGWLSTCAAALEAQSYVGVAVQYGANTVHGSLGENEIALEHGINAPFNTLGYQGEDFYTDYRYIAWDSAYCLDNGFLDQSRYNVEAVHDFAHMTELAEEYCDELLQEFPDMRQHSMNELMEHAGQNQGILVDEASLPLGLRTLQQPTPWNNRRHAAWKCVLGGLGCDMSNCAYSYCLRDSPAGHGSFIGHGVQCREDWLPREDIEAYAATIGNGVSVP